MPRPVPAATQTLAVLRYLANQPRPVAATTIATELGIPRSSLYHLLATMEADGFVVHLPEERRYGLGSAAYEIGSAHLRHEGLERLARTPLARLTRVTRANVHLGVLDGRDVLYLVEERPRDPLPLVTDVGARLPVHLTASGRAILAHAPVAQTRALYPDGSTLTRRTGKGPASLRELTRVLERVRRQGFATENGEVAAGYGSVGVPTFDHAGRPIAAVTATIRQEPASGRSRLERLVDPVQATALEVTRRLRGRAPGALRGRPGP